MKLSVSQRIRSSLAVAKSSRQERKNASRVGRDLKSAERLKSLRKQRVRVSSSRKLAEALVRERAILRGERSALRSARLDGVSRFVKGAAVAAKKLNKAKGKIKPSKLDTFTKPSEEHPLFR